VDGDGRGWGRSTRIGKHWALSYKEIGARVRCPLHHVHRQQCPVHLKKLEENDKKKSLRKYV
jgi:hypothetical protein